MLYSYGWLLDWFPIFSIGFINYNLNFGNNCHLLIAVLCMGPICVNEKFNNFPAIFSWGI